MAEAVLCTCERMRESRVAAQQAGDNRSKCQSARTTSVAERETGAMDRRCGGGDSWIGMCAAKAGIQPTFDPRFSTTPAWAVAAPETKVSFHRMRPVAGRIDFEIDTRCRVVSNERGPPVYQQHRCGMLAHGLETRAPFAPRARQPTRSHTLTHAHTRADWHATYTCTAR
jgi:hypothetical protein